MLNLRPPVLTGETRRVTGTAYQLTRTPVLCDTAISHGKDNTTWGSLVTG
jgi:hypothetical protein